jgi:hypothetical protein
MKIKKETARQHDMTDGIPPMQDNKNKHGQWFGQPSLGRQRTRYRVRTGHPVDFGGFLLQLFRGRQATRTSRFRRRAYWIGASGAQKARPSMTEVDCRCQILSRYPDAVQTCVYSPSQHVDTA